MTGNTCKHSWRPLYQPPYMHVHRVHEEGVTVLRAARCWLCGLESAVPEEGLVDEETEMGNTCSWKELVEAAREVNLFVGSWMPKRDEEFYQFRSVATGDDVSAAISGFDSAVSWLDGYKIGLSRAEEITQEQSEHKTAADVLDFDRYEYGLRNTPARPSCFFEAYRVPVAEPASGLPFVLACRDRDCFGSVVHRFWFRDERDLVKAMTDVACLEHWEAFRRTC